MLDDTLIPIFLVRDRIITANQRKTTLICFANFTFNGDLTDTDHRRKKTRSDHNRFFLGGRGALHVYIDI